MATFWTSSSSSQTGATVPSGSNGHFTYPNTCTFVAPKYGNYDGCYMYRSCQSCLETSGCLINDYGICVSATEGMYVLATNSYAYSTSYNPDMNYRNAVRTGLALPNAAYSPESEAEQNWHFLAGEATYCSANDAVCQECKTKNFWRSSDQGALPDSRFCVGKNDCVCIQTCEVPTYKNPGCQWKLSSPNYGYNNNNGYYNNNGYDSLAQAHMRWWEWLTVLAVILVVHFLFKCCNDKERTMAEVRKVAVRAVHQELGIPEEPVVVVSAVPRTARPHRTTTAVTEESLSPRSDYGEDALRIETPREHDNSTTVFIDFSSQPPLRSAGGSA